MRAYDYCLRARSLMDTPSGIGPGDRVALHMYNGSELAIGYFACFYAGAIAVPINTRMKAPESKYSCFPHSTDPSLRAPLAKLYGPCGQVHKRPDACRARRGRGMRASASPSCRSCKGAPEARKGHSSSPHLALGSTFAS